MVGVASGGCLVAEMVRMLLWLRLALCKREGGEKWERESVLKLLGLK